MATEDELRQLRIEAYAIISENPCSLFPEFDFRRNGKGWYSGNTLKVDGSVGTAKNAVWIYDDRPGYLYDYRGGQSVTFWDYLDAVRGVSSVFKTLIEYAGLTIPASPSSRNEPIELVAKIHPYILSKCQQIFTDDLGVSDIGCEVRAYLAQRGYDDKQVDRMKLGVLPDITELKERLKKELSIEDKYINFFISRMYSYANHRLTIPCYGKHGRLEGFIFRTIDPSSLPNGDSKYKNMMDIDRSSGVLNVPRGTTEVIIVEGVLDALLAKAEGIRNVVSLNGSGLNNEQIMALAEIGIERIVLCLDNDDTGRDSTYRMTKRILEHDANMMVYITQLAEGIKDVDEFITKHGRDAFIEEVHYSIGMGEYIAKELIKQYPKRDVMRPLPAMQRDRLLDAAKFFEPYLNTYKHEFTDFERELEAFVL